MLHVYENFGWDLAEWVKRLVVNAKVTKILGSIPAFSDTVESEGRQMKECWIMYIPLVSKYLKTSNLIGKQIGLSLGLKGMELGIAA